MKRFAVVVMLIGVLLALVVLVGKAAGKETTPAN